MWAGMVVRVPRNCEQAAEYSPKKQHWVEPDKSNRHILPPAEPAIEFWPVDVSEHEPAQHEEKIDRQARRKPLASREKAQLMQVQHGKSRNRSQPIKRDVARSSACRLAQRAPPFASYPGAALTFVDNWNKAAGKTR